MPTVRYTSVHGEVLAEKRDGVRRFYVPDPLGSTVALLDSSQTKTDTFTYWPYGEVKDRTGTTATPLQLVGTQGYYRDKVSRVYVRARHLRVDQGRWLTEDPVWFGGNWYTYVSARPVCTVDTSGLREGGVGPGQCPGKDAYDSVKSWLEHASKRCRDAFQKACPVKGGLPALVKSIRFEERERCFGQTDKSCVYYGFVPPRRRGGRRICVPKEICFTTYLCDNPRDFMTLPCLLLLELSNWCSCKYHNRSTDEKIAEKVLRACALWDICRTAGVVLST